MLACSGLGDVPVKTQDFCENENEHHADKDSRLAHKGAHALLQLASLSLFHHLLTTGHTASPTIPMAYPAARPDKPTDNPAAMCMNPAYSEYVLLGGGLMSLAMRTDMTSE